MLGFGSPPVFQKRDTVNNADECAVGAWLGDARGAEIDVRVVSRRAMCAMFRGKRLEKTMRDASCDDC